MESAASSIEEVISGTGLSGELKAIAEKVVARERISFDEGVRLFEEGELGLLL